MDDITRPGGTRPRPYANPQRPRVASPLNTGGTAIPVSTPSAAPAPAPTQIPIQVDAPKPIPMPNLMPTQLSNPVSSPEPEPESGSTLPDLFSPAPDANLEPVGQVTDAPTTIAKKKSHWGAVLVATIIALALIGGAGYAYLQNKDNAVKPATNPTSTKQVKQTETAAKASDVTSATDSINKTIKEVDDTAGAAETDLSDTTLGVQ